MWLPVIYAVINLILYRRRWYPKTLTLFWRRIQRASLELCTTGHNRTQWKLVETGWGCVDNSGLSWSGLSWSLEWSIFGHRLGDDERRACSRRCQVRSRAVQLQGVVCMRDSCNCFSLSCCWSMCWVTNSWGLYRVCDLHPPPRPRNERRDIRRRNFACKTAFYLCNTWAGSDIDRGHHWEENCTLKRALVIEAYKSLELQAPGSPVVGWTVHGYEYRHHGSSGCRRTVDTSSSSSSCSQLGSSCSSSYALRIDWRSRISGMTSCFQDGDHDVITWKAYIVRRVWRHRPL